MLVQFSVVVPASRQAAFAYIANFVNIAGWDPGVKSSKQLTSGPAGLNTEYELVTLFKGQESTMKYVVREWDPCNKVVLTGDSPTVSAVDTIRFSDAAGGATSIDYSADIRLKGLLSLFTWAVSSDIRKLGDAAKAGMAGAFETGKHKM